MELTEKHFEVMEAVEDGATIWAYAEAKLLRELQQYNPNYITIIDNLDELARIEGKKFNGADKLPYFGAILTDGGKRFLDLYNSNKSLNE